MDAVLNRCEIGRRPAAATSNVRAVFISDVHIGCLYARTGTLLEFLEQVKPEFVYLVGDFIDGWELRRRWRWSSEVTQILRFLVDLSRQGCVVRYAVGNHDDFLRGNSLLAEFAHAGGIEIAEEFIHVTEDGRRFLVIHGDRFDRYSHCSAVMEWLASTFYKVLLAANNLWQRWFGGHHGVVSSRVKSSFQAMARHVAQFRSDAVEYARSRRCEGVICGHVHAPEHSQVQGVEYCNTGDWLENCSAMIERYDHGLELHFEGVRLAKPRSGP